MGELLGSDKVKDANANLIRLRCLHPGIHAREGSFAIAADPSRMSNFDGVTEVPQVAQSHDPF
jgi:hypothetical protein